MIDNTRLAHGQRCAVVLNNFSDQSADLTAGAVPRRLRQPQGEALLQRGDRERAERKSCAALKRNG